MRVVLLVAALWAPLGLAATPPPQALAPAIAGQTEGGPDYLKFGVSLDAGVPDGIGLSGVYRPFYWLRANAGLAYNGFGYGVRGGFSLAPFYFPITPVLSADVGHFFEANVTTLVQKATPDTDLSQAGDALKHVGYDYASAQVGFEVGSPRRFTFSLRVGYSYLQTTLTGFEAALQSASGDSTIEAKPVKVKVTFPSAKLGFTLYF